MPFQDQFGASDSIFGNIEFGIGAPPAGSGATFSAVTAQATATGSTASFTGGAVFAGTLATTTYTAAPVVFGAGAVLAALTAEATATGIAADLTSAWFSAVTAQALAYAPAPGSTDGTSGFYPAEYGELP